MSNNDLLEIGGKKFKSRLLLGTGKFFSNTIIPDVIKAAQSEIVTVALRRIDPEKQNENIVTFINEDITLMPNTSGARNAEEAVRIAKLSKALGYGNFIKIEVISDNRYLLPDNFETIKATEILVKEGFTVLPYMSPDLMAAKKLVEAGAAVVMPLGAPIGTNRGLKTKELVRILIEEIPLPVIVDAGLGKPSEAAEALEMGAAAVLVNTAIATAGDPVNMADAFRMAVEAGRKAFLAGPGQTQEYASASSPLTGFLNE